MFERINTQQDLLNHQLSAAITMERTSLEMLENTIQEARDSDIQSVLRNHQDETHRQIDNLEAVFSAFGWQSDEASSPAIQGIDKESKANIKKADSSIVDSVILSGAAQTEHHEIAVYENLITQAKALGRQDAAQLLQENLEQEQRMLEEVKSATQRMASAAARQTA